MTHDARDKAFATWACSEGPHSLPGVTSVDVWLQDRVPRDKPLNFVMFGGIPLVHRELLVLLGDDNVERDLYIGRVFGRGGKELADWVTARGRRRVIMRGTKDAGYRLCPGCGRVLYEATGVDYLYPMPPGDAAIFESNQMDLVVTRDIAEKVAGKWRRLRIEPLAVLDPPPDGLGVLPE